jgi:hypothetical protein
MNPVTTTNAIKSVHQNQVRMAIIRLRDLTYRLESDMDKDPGGVVSWLLVQSIMEEALNIVYAAGQVNGAHFAGGGRQE